MTTLALPARLALACVLTALLPLSATAAESGIALENFDHSVRPQDDFYRHVNGLWLKNTRIPDDQSNYGSFSGITDRTEIQLREIITDSAATPSATGSETQKIGDLYASFMNEAAITQRGLNALEAELNRIDLLNQHEDLPALLADLDRLGSQGLFGGYVDRDAKDPLSYVLYLGQDGLGLPDREYYLEDSPKFLALRKQYVAYATQMLQLAGTIDASQQAQHIFALETALARLHWTNVANRDAEKTYNRYGRDSINALTPGFDFVAYLDRVGAGAADAIVIQQPSYFSGLGALINATSLETWREYLRLRLLTTYAPYLSEPFVALQFSFYGRSLNGIAENRPRWKRGVDTVEAKLGEALGKIYVERHFPAEAKTRMEKMVANLITAYSNSIKNLDWMSEATREQALAKLAQFTPKIGYPDKWTDYSALQIGRSDLVSNIRNANRYQHDKELAKLGQPINVHEWHMTPQTVNAYYNPVGNEIVFPAAILQPPFFNLAADDAVNYGAIGSVIGHEIGHGFDDQGSRYDGTGQLRNWWTDEDRSRFETRTRQLITQYDAYAPLPGYTVNGALTIGENIGDLGGLSIALKAYALSLGGSAAPVMDNYTGIQRVMIGWAQVWRRLYREEALINRLKTDPHSPSEYRCNGIMSNLPDFVDSFKVEAQDRMYIVPEQRVSIW